MSPETTKPDVHAMADDQGIPPQRQPQPPPENDRTLVARLRAGDERAFAEVVDAWSPMLLRMARMFVSTDASGQEIVQETWLAVIKGLDRFEGRSSLRTWVLGILANLGKTRGAREARAVPWSALAATDSGPTVDPSRFRGIGDAYPHNWTPDGVPRAWEPSPEDALLARETRGKIATALEDLPDRQRVVVTLRDLHGLPAAEVCAALDITAANQRVLLHRGRAHLRSVLEDYYRGRAVTMA